MSAHRPHSAGLAHCLSKRQFLCLHRLCNNCCPGPERQKDKHYIKLGNEQENLYNRENMKEAFGTVGYTVFGLTALSYKISVMYMFL